MEIFLLVVKVKPCSTILGFSLGTQIGKILVAAICKLKNQNTEKSFYLFLNLNNCESVYISEHKIAQRANSVRLLKYMGIVTLPRNSYDWCITFSSNYFQQCNTTSTKTWMEENQTHWFPKNHHCFLAP